MAMQKLRGERSLLPDDSIHAIRLTKYVIRVTGAGHAHEMSITPSLMQARRPAYAVYITHMEEEKTRKAKDMQQKTKTAKDDQNTQNKWHPYGVYPEYVIIWNFLAV